MFYTLITLPVIVINLMLVVWLSFFKKPSRNKIGVVISICLLILSHNQFVIYGHIRPELNNLTFYLTFTDAVTFFLYTPIFYVYLLNLLEDRPYLSHKNAIHLWPSLPGLIYCMLFYTMSDVNRHLFVNAQWHGLIPNHLIFLIGCSCILYYCGRSIRLIQSYIHRYHDRLQSHSIRELNLFIWTYYFFMMFCVSFFVVVIFYSNMIYVSRIALIVFFISSLVQWGFLFAVKEKNLEDIQDLSKKLKSMPLMNGVDVVRDRECKKIKELIEKRVVKDEMFRIKNLTLNQMASNCGISPTQLSSTLNTQYQKTFSNFVNEYRIAYAKNRMVIDSDLKMDFLANECGFASRSSFYIVFKKHAGCTPVEFRNRAFTSS
jgi:AraC-like DNA-binding protein